MSSKAVWVSLTWYPSSSSLVTNFVVSKIGLHRGAFRTAFWSSSLKFSHASDGRTCFFASDKISLLVKGWGLI